jgi:phage-related protein
MGEGCGNGKLVAFYTCSGIITSMDKNIKTLEWIGTAKKDLFAMPDDVKRAFGFALHLAQVGQMHVHTKVLKGFGSAGVLEVVENSSGGTYRAVYTVKFEGVVYVLHCFQKKSTQGISTPKPDMEIIRERLKAAERLANGGIR